MPDLTNAARELLEYPRIIGAETMPDEVYVPIDFVEEMERALRSALEASVSVPSDMVVGLTAVSTQPRYAGWVFVKHVDGTNWTTAAKLTPETWGMVQQQLPAPPEAKP